MSQLTRFCIFRNVTRILTGTLVVLASLTSIGYGKDVVMTSADTTVEPPDPRKSAWFWLEEKSVDGDVWAKYFLARAHLHVLQDVRERQLSEKFSDLSLPEDVRTYWNAYQEALRDNNFVGSDKEFLELTHAGLKMQFKPLLSLRVERDKNRPIQKKPEFEYEKGPRLENVGNLVQFPSKEMRAGRNSKWATIAGLEGRYAVGAQISSGEVIKPISYPDMFLRFARGSNDIYQMEYWRGFSPIAYFDVHFLPFDESPGSKQKEGAQYLGIVCPSQSLGAQNQWGHVFIAYFVAERCFFIVLLINADSQAGQFHVLMVDRANKEQHGNLFEAIKAANGSVRVDKETLSWARLVLISGISEPASWVKLFRDPRVTLTHSIKYEYLFTRLPEDRSTLDAKAHIEQGERFFRERDYSNAALEYEEVVRLIPTYDNPEARRGYTGAASSYYQLKEYDKVIQHVAAAIKGGAKDRNLYLLAAIAYWQKDQLGPAQANLDQAYAMDPKDGNVNYMLAALEVSLPWKGSKDIYARFVRSDTHCRKSGGVMNDEGMIAKCLEMVKPLRDEYEKQTYEAGMRNAERYPLVEIIGPNMRADTLVALFGAFIVVTAMQSVLGPASRPDSGEPRDPYCGSIVAGIVGGGSGCLP